MGQTETKKKPVQTFDLRKETWMNDFGLRNEIYDNRPKYRFRLDRNENWANFDQTKTKRSLGQISCETKTMILGR